MRPQAELGGAKPLRAGVLIERVIFSLEGPRRNGNLGVAPGDLQEARRADMVFHTYSLDAPVFDREDPVPLADLLGEDDRDVEQTLDMEAVSAHWKELPQREQRILTMRFYGNLTQAEIGERLGISQMHVSRLLARALSYLRDRLLGRNETEDGEIVSML